MKMFYTLFFLALPLIAMEQHETVLINMLSNLEKLLQNLEIELTNNIPVKLTEEQKQEVKNVQSELFSIVFCLSEARTSDEPFFEPENITPGRSVYFEGVVDEFGKMHAIFKSIFESMKKLKSVNLRQVPTGRKNEYSEEIPLSNTNNMQREIFQPASKIKEILNKYNKERILLHSNQKMSNGKSLKEYFDDVSKPLIKVIDEILELLKQTNQAETTGCLIS